MVWINGLMIVLLVEIGNRGGGGGEGSGCNLCLIFNKNFIK